MKNSSSMPSLKANLGYSSLYQILIIIMPLITAPYVSRVLGVENIGKYSYAYSVAHIFQSIAYLGIKNYGTRTIANCGDDSERSKTFTSIFLMQLIFGTIVTTIYSIYSMHLEGVVKGLALIHIFYVALAFVDISWFFFGVENFKVTVIRNTIIRLATVVLIFAFVKTEKDLLLYAGIVVVGSFVGQLTLWMYLGKYITYARVKASDVLKHVKPNLLLFIPVIAVNVYKYMDKVMIGYLSNDHQTGLYESAEKIVRIPSSIITALGTVMLSRHSNIQDADYSRKVIKISMKVSSFIGFSMGFGIIAISDSFIPVFFGNNFNGASPILSALALSVFAVSWANVIRTQYLLPNKLDKFYTISVSAGCIINLIGNYFLIRVLQAMGAAMVTVLTEYVVLFIQGHYSRRTLDFKRYISDNFHFMINGLIMVIIGKWIGAQFTKLGVLTVLIQIVVCALYFVCSSFLVLRYVKKDKDLSYVIHKFRDKKYI